MRYSHALSLVFLLCVSIQANEVPSAVLVRATFCGTKTGITSSGVPVLFRGKHYVLTSQWGVFEETSGVCHEVVDPITRRAHEATLVGLDWGIGFALLEAPAIPAIVDLESVTGLLPSAADLETHGFSKVGDLEKKQGRVIASKSTRHHLAALPYSYEVISDRVTSSFVGAPVYGTSLDGIVSSQWIEVVAGSRARIHEWRTKSDAAVNHLIVIPVGLIRESLKRGLPKRATYQTASDKLENRSRLHVGKHLWEILCPQGAGEPPPDGIGPIGGADGVGVGGSMKGAETCKMRVTKQDAVELAYPDFFPAKLSQELEKGLSRDERLVLPFLAGRNAGTYIARVPFFSAPHFFNELAKGKRNWVLLRDTAPPAGTTAYERLLLENARLQKILLDTYPLIATREDDRDDYRFIYTHSVIIESLNWKLVLWKDYSSLITRTSPADFVKDVEWEGRPLRLLIRESLEKLEKLYMETGGDR